MNNSNDEKPVHEDPWQEFAGMFKEDPWWKRAIEEYRQKVEDYPDAL